MSEEFGVGGVKEGSSEPLHRYDYHVLDAAQSLHEHVNGASDPLSQRDAARLYVFLNMRLATWQASAFGCQKYDDAVRRLIETAINDFDESHWKEQEEISNVHIGISRIPFMCHCGFDVFRKVGPSSDGVTGYMCNKCGREYSGTGK